MHIQAPPSPVCIAPKRGAASFSKPVFHHRGGQGDSALLIHILRCLLSHSLLFFSPALKEQTTWNIIAERMCQSVSALSRLSSKDEVFLGVAEPSLWRLSLQHFICNSTTYRRTFTYSTVCLLQLVHICLGIMFTRGEGKRGVTVAAWGESAFCSRRFSLRTRPNCWGLQFGSNLQQQADKPRVCGDKNPRSLQLYGVTQQ